MFMLYRCITNSTCSVSERSTPRTPTGSHGNKTETLKTCSRGSMRTRKIPRRIKSILLPSMVSTQPASMTQLWIQPPSSWKRREGSREGRWRRRGKTRRKNGDGMTTKSPRWRGRRGNGRKSSPRLLRLPVNPRKLTHQAQTLQHRKPSRSS